MQNITFTTKREGYGRQGLYFNWKEHTIKLCSIFPNIEEHFSHYAMESDCFYNEEKQIYYNSDGQEVTPIVSWDVFLFEQYKDEIGQLLYEWDDWCEIYNWEKMTYEEIAEWANNN